VTQNWYSVPLPLRYPGNEKESGPRQVDRSRKGVRSRPGAAGALRG
jgi:hypothetical protein